MLERVISAAAALLIPALGLVLQASRRNRLRQRIEEYTGLAAEFAQRDPEVAGEFAQLASEAARILLLRDQRWLRRKIDPAAVFAVLFLTVPMAAAFVWSWTWSSGWRWPVIVITGTWTLLWGGVGVTQLWKERGDDVEANSTIRPAAATSEPS